MYHITFKLFNLKLLAMLFMRFGESRPHSVQGKIQAHFEAMYAHRNGIRTWFPVHSIDYI